MATFTEDLTNNFFKRNPTFSANKITKKSDVEELIKAYHELFTRIEEIEKKQEEIEKKQEEIEKKQKKQEKRNKHIVYRSYG